MGGQRGRLRGWALGQPGPGRIREAAEKAAPAGVGRGGAGRRQPWRVWGLATFPQGLGSQLALRARSAEGQKGTGESLCPTWGGGAERVLRSCRAPCGHPLPLAVPLRAHHQLGACLGCHCHSRSC